MGIDRSVAQFLGYCNQRNFGKTLQLGHQLLFNDFGPGHVTKYKSGDFSGRYFEEILGSSEVETLDYSSYEGCSIEHDLNKPIPNELIEQYDTVFDGGTLEHVYNIACAMDNVSSLCKNGGTIIHALPANNFCGHGLYQFSPELFLSQYSSENGFKETEIFVCQVNRTKKWYRVIQLGNGERINIRSRGPVYIFVKTRKSFTGRKPMIVQQSDYETKWNSHKKLGVNTNAKAKTGALYKVSLKLPFRDRLSQLKFKIYSGLNRWNPGLESVKIESRNIL